MDKKNVAATVTTILCALLFIVIGSTFSAFVYSKELVEVVDPRILISDNGEINVFDASGDKEISTLKLSTMKLGLKPTTGEEDVITSIPSTVTNKQGSEGQYASFKLHAPNGAKVVIKNIKIDSEEAEEDILKERENIMIAIMEIENSAKSLSEEEVVLGEAEANYERVSYTFLIWLSAKASEKLEASKISFDISFESI